MTGYHLWAERYDRDLQEIFVLQDEIAFKIMKTVHERLPFLVVQARGLSRGVRDLEAFLKVMEAREHFYRVNKEDNVIARRLYQEAIDLDPDYAFAYAALGYTHMADIWIIPLRNRSFIDRTIENLRKAG